MPRRCLIPYLKSQIQDVLLAFLFFLDYGVQKLPVVTFVVFAMEAELRITLLTMPNLTNHDNLRSLLHQAQVSGLARHISQQVQYHPSSGNPLLLTEQQILQIMHPPSVFISPGVRARSPI